MEIRISHRTEGEAKPAGGLVGAMGGVLPVGATETTVEITDAPDGTGRIIAEAAIAFATVIDSVHPAGIIEYVGDEETTEEAI